MTASDRAFIFRLGIFTCSTTIATVAGFIPDMMLAIVASIVAMAFLATVLYEFFLVVICDEKDDITEQASHTRRSIRDTITGIEALGTSHLTVTIRHRDAGEQFNINCTNGGMPEVYRGDEVRLTPASTQDSIGEKWDLAVLRRARVH